MFSLSARPIIYRTKEKQGGKKIKLCSFQGLLKICNDELDREVKYSEVTYYIRLCRFIKLSSPRMNNVIVVGAILIYIAGILLGIDGNFVSSDVEAILRCRVSSIRIEPLTLNITFFETSLSITSFVYVFSRNLFLKSNCKRA